MRNGRGIKPAVSLFAASELKMCERNSRGKSHMLDGGDGGRKEEGGTAHPSFMSQ